MKFKLVLLSIMDVHYRAMAKIALWWLKE